MIPQIKKEEDKRDKAIRIARDNLDYYEWDNNDKPAFEKIIYCAFSRHLLSLLQKDEIVIQPWMLKKWGLIMDNDGTLKVAYRQDYGWKNIKAPFQPGNILNG